MAYYSFGTGTLVQDGITIADTGLTIQSGGATITGNSSITGTFSASGAITASGGVTMGGALNMSTNNITNGGTAAFTSLTLSSGATITGNSSVTGDLTVSGALSVGTFTTNSVASAGGSALTLTGTNGTVNIAGNVVLGDSNTLTLKNSATNYYRTIMGQATTTTAATTPVVTFATASDYVYLAEVSVSAYATSDETATFSYLVKFKNVAGTVTISTALVNKTTISDSNTVFPTNSVTATVDSTNVNFNVVTADTTSRKWTVVVRITAQAK